MQFSTLRFAAMVPRATIVVHLAGGREEANSCLQTLAALSPEPAHETIVVDDATAGLDDLIDGLPADVRIVRNERREGLVSCATQAATQATGEAIVLLRGTPELQPGALEPLLAPLADPGLAAVAASLPLKPDSHPACSHALALRREDVAGLARVVGAEPGCELAAICIELAMSGRRIVTAPDAVAAPARARDASTRSELGQPIELTIVIPTLDATSDHVRACVSAIQARTEVPHEIILIDNGAPPQGFSAPVNAGLRATDSPYVVVMNDDVEPQAGWWPPLKRALDEGASVVFPMTEESWYRTDFSAWCFGLSQATLEEMAHSPDAFFDPQLRIWYQDTDLLARLREAECPPKLVRESRVKHGLSLTVESDNEELKHWIAETIAEDRAAFERKHPGVPVNTAD